MKVNFKKEVSGIPANKILVGQCFLADRKSTTAKGLYMKVDSNSGLTRGTNDNSILAVNLESGQLRRFVYNFLVQLADVEVNFKEGK